MKHFDRIEKYLSGALSPESAAALEREMLEDTELALEFKLQQFEQQALEWEYGQSLEEKIKQYRTEVHQEVPAGKPRVLGVHSSRWLLRIAAGILFIVALGLSWHYLLPADPAVLADQYYNMRQPSFSNSTTKGVDDAPITTDPYQLGLNALEQKQHRTAIDIFDQVSSTDPYFLDARYFQAHAQYLAGDFKEASSSFQFYIDRVPATERQLADAQFYQVLALLKDGQKAAAKKRIQAILADPQHRFGPMLKELNTEL